MRVPAANFKQVARPSLNLAIFDQYHAISETEQDMTSNDLELPLSTQTHPNFYILCVAFPIFRTSENRHFKFRKCVFQI